MNHKPYLETRSKKLAEQLPEKSSTPEADVLRGVRVYIDGYLANSTDIEMKRIIKLAGGQAMSVQRAVSVSGRMLNGLLGTRRPAPRIS